jgi:predicted ATPase
MRAARDASNLFPDGVGFVTLAPVGDSDLVVPAVAKTLVCETDPSDHASASLGLQGQMGRRRASGILRTRSRLLLIERA